LLGWVAFACALTAPWRSTILMIENKPIGLLSLIDEECMYPSGGDKSLASKLYQHLPAKSDRFVATHQLQRDYCFVVKHFAGDVRCPPGRSLLLLTAAQVTYSCEGFYRKNKNELRQDAVDLICASSNALVGVLLPRDAAEAAGGADMAAYFSKRASEIGEDAMVRAARVRRR
jgi:myosin-5